MVPKLHFHSKSRPLDALIARAPNRLKMSTVLAVLPKVLLRRQSVMPSRYAASRSIQRGSSFCRRAKCIGKSTHRQGRPFCMSYFSDNNELALFERDMIHCRFFGAEQISNALLSRLFFKRSSTAN